MHGPHSGLRRVAGGGLGERARQVGLHKILFHFKALLLESIILLLPPPHLQSLPYCNTIARPLRNIRAPADLPLLCHMPYNISDGNIV